MKVALIADSHFGCRNDHPLFIEYFKDFYNNIFFPHLELNGITHVIHHGDVMDRRRYINFNTYNLTRKFFLEGLRDRGITMDITVGNHDCYFKNKNDVNSPSELFGLYPNIKIFSEPSVQTYDGLDIQLMPWINPSNAEHCLNVMKTSRCLVMMGHLELKGFQMYRGVTCEHGLDPSVLDRFSLVTSGHFHHKSTTGNINYLGSPYEMTFADMDDPRGFHIFDTNDLSLKFIQNPGRMFFKETYNDKGVDPDIVMGIDFEKFHNRFVKVMVTAKTNPYVFERYLEKLMSVNPADISILDEITVTMQNGNDDKTLQADDTLTVLNNYVDNMELDISPDRLKNIFHELHAGVLAGEDDQGEK